MNRQKKIELIKQFLEIIGEDHLRILYNRAMEMKSDHKDSVIIMTNYLIKYRDEEIEVDLSGKIELGKNIFPLISSDQAIKKMNIDELEKYYNEAIEARFKINKIRMIDYIKKIYQKYGDIYQRRHKLSTINQLEKMSRGAVHHDFVRIYHIEAGINYQGFCYIFEETKCICDACKSLKDNNEQTNND